MLTKSIHQAVEQGEKRNTYQLRIVFNKRKIIEVTITDHYQQKPGREKITDGLILELLKKLDGKRLRPIKYSGVRKVYK
jgi:hypothetical protein